MRLLTEENASLQARRTTEVESLKKNAADQLQQERDQRLQEQRRALELEQNLKKLALEKEEDQVRYASMMEGKVALAQMRGAEEARADA